jgi:hypothetical protein
MIDRRLTAIENMVRAATQSLATPPPPTGGALSAAEIATAADPATASPRNKAKPKQAASPRAKPSPKTPKRRAAPTVVSDEDDEEEDEDDDDDDIHVIDDGDDDDEEDFACELMHVDKFTFRRKDNEDLTARAESYFITKASDLFRGTPPASYITQVTAELKQLQQWLDMGTVVAQAGRTQKFMLRGAKIAWEIRATLAHHKRTADFTEMVKRFPLVSADGLPTPADFVKQLTRCNKPEAARRSQPTGEKKDTGAKATTSKSKKQGEAKGGE